MYAAFGTPDPRLDIKGIKKKGSAPLEWHSPLHPRVREPRTIGWQKKKMRPILGLMIIGELNEAIDNQYAFRTGVGGGIVMEVLGGVAIARNFGHFKDGVAPPNPPHHTLLGSLKHTICDPFEDWQIVELVGVVLVVVGTPMIALRCAAGPRILGPAHNGGVLIENGCLL